MSTTRTIKETLSIQIQPNQTVEKKEEKIEDSKKLMIFNKMNPETSYKLLETEKKSWLLRESRQLGMLTLDLYVNAEGKKSEYKSSRFCFTKEGWISANDELLDSANKVKITLTAETVGSYVNSLLELVYSVLKILGCRKDDQLLPAPEQQTTLAIYSSYATRTSLLSLKESNKTSNQSDTSKTISSSSSA